MYVRLTVLLALLIAGTVAAQSYELVLDEPILDPDRPILPIDEKSQVVLGFEIVCPLGSIGSPVPMGGGTVELELTNAQNLEVSGSTNGYFPLPDCVTATSYSDQISINVTPRRDAPGLEEIDVGVSGNLSYVLAPGVPDEKIAAEPTQFTITPAFYDSLDVKAPVKLLKMDGRNREFLVNVSNFGNSLVKIDWQIVGDLQELEVIEPEATILAPRGQENAVARVTVNLVASGCFGDQNFELIANPSPVLDDQIKGEPISTFMLVRGGDCLIGQGANGLGVAALVIALAFATIIGRRRQ